MPRVRNPKFRRVRSRVNWERPPGGRLLRLDNAAHYVDSDILVYDIDGVNAVAVAQHTTDQRIPPLPLPHSGSTKSTDIFNFEKRIAEITPDIGYLNDPVKVNNKMQVHKYSLWTWILF